jgi:hypothetical protein
MGFVGIVCLCVGGAVGFVIGERKGRRKVKLLRPRDISSGETGWHDSQDGWRTVDPSADK